MLNYLFPRDHFHLIYKLAYRDIQQRFRSTWLGFGWAILVPLLMLVIYTVAFQTVFQARWPGQESMPPQTFALNLFAGLIFFQWFMDMVQRSSSAVIDQPNLVKKVIFPLETLAWIQILSSGFQAMISLIILLAGITLFHGSLSWQALYIPLLVLLWLPLLLGLGWLLSGLGVYFRDIQPLIGLAAMPLLFLSPVFYPASALPEWVAPFLWLNPLTLMITSLRALILGGDAPSLYAITIFGATSMAVALLGAFVFQKLRKGFADVL